MRNIKTGGPAFPTENEQQTGPVSYHYAGMTLRDYFASNAPPEVINLEGWTVKQCELELGLPEGVRYEWRKHYCRLVAMLSYEYADSMLEARK